MSFFSHIAKVVRHVVRRPARSVARVVHNPTRALLNKSVRSSNGFHNIARPIIKVGAGLAAGALTGGIGFAGGALAFSGLSGAGALAGGLSSAAAGGLTGKAFRPVSNLIVPAAAGLVAGNVARGSQLAKNVQSLQKGVSGIKGAAKTVHAVKAAKAHRAQQIAQVAQLSQERKSIAAINARIAAIKKQSAQASAIKEKGKSAGVSGGTISATNHGATMTMAAAGFAATSNPIIAAGAAVVGLYLDNKKTATQGA